MSAGVHQINDANGAWVAECMAESARLIAAAPELLDALKNLHAHCTAPDEFMRAAEFVIAKATGP